MSAIQGPPGFYGKLPAVGDFVHRRLPPAFVDPWHAAMQGLLHAIGAGAATLECPAPVWRFVLRPGLAGTAAWAGAMRASVDRVGRGFPLVIAAPLHRAEAEGTAAAAATPTWRPLSGWLEAAAAVLCRVGTECRQDGTWLDRACLALAPHEHRGSSMPAVPPFADASGTGGSLWWTAMTGVAPGAWMHIAGWPAACHAPALLGRACAPGACVVEALQ